MDELIPPAELDESAHTHPSEPLRHSEARSQSARLAAAMTTTMVVMAGSLPPGGGVPITSTSADCGTARVTNAIGMSTNCWRQVQSCPVMIACRSGPKLSGTI